MISNIILRIPKINILNVKFLSHMISQKLYLINIFKLIKQGCKSFIINRYAIEFKIDRNSSLVIIN